MDRQAQALLNGSLQPSVLPHGLRRRLSPRAVLQQQPPAKVAAVPSFTEDGQPIRQAGVRVSVTVQQQQQQQQQQQPPMPQQNGWLLQPWSNSRGQEPLQQDAQTQEPQQHQQFNGEQQLWQQHMQQQQQHDPLALQLQRCRDWTQVAALVSSASQEQQLDFTTVVLVLQQLSRCVQPKALPQQPRQHLDSLLTRLAEAAVVQLQSLQHQEVGQLLAGLQVLDFKPSVAWVKSVLQHAGTTLMHYTPAELALLLLTATQTAARVAGSAPPPMQLMRSSPTAAPAVVMETHPAAAATAAVAGGSSGGGGGGSPSTTAARRANTVLTSAWLQHFMMTFERFLAARTAHPQLQPQHLEAVITCLAALRVTPDRFWLYLFVRQMTAQLPACPPGSVVRIMSALASMGYRLPDHVVSQIERQVGGPALATLRPQECVEAVKSVAALKQKPSEAWVRQLLAAALKGSSHLSASAVVTLMVCAAGLGIELHPSWIDCLLMQARTALHVLTVPEHVGLMDALSQQQHRPGPVFMSLYMSQVQAHLPELTLGQQAVLIASLATVGYKPAPAWMAAFMGQLSGQQVTAGDAADLLKLLTALRRMQYVPTTAVAQQLEGLIDGIAASLSYQQLQQLRGALAELQYRPSVAAAAVNSSRSFGQAAVAAAAAVTNAAASAAPAAAMDGDRAEIAVLGQAQDQQQGQPQPAAAAVAAEDEEIDEQQQAVGDKPTPMMQSLELLA